MNKDKDAAARRTALDPERSFIVQAPAGSGKTELLTQRYLRLLATVESPEQILAITFTRKAAGEMRDRVLKAIAAAADETPPTEAHRALTWKLARAVRERDAEAGWQLASYPSRLRIDTLDSFTGSLTRRLPLTAGLGVTPHITERARELYVEAARRTVAALEDNNDFADAVAALLAHLDYDTQKLEELLVGMLAKRDQWLRLIHRGGNRDLLEAALAREVEAQLVLLRASVPADAGSDMVELARAAAQNVIRAGRESDQCACAELDELPGTAADHLKAWQALACTWLTKERAWRRQLTRREGFPADQKAFKAQAQALLSRLVEAPAFHVRLAAVRDLPPVEYTDQQWAILQALIELLKLAAAQLQVVFGEQGSVDFTEIALRALQALGDAGAPTDLGLALDYRLQHILVDEFQDTSWSQFALLERLTAGWTPGDGRTLFLVGDPMQSIYRFREAEVGLYLRAWHEGIGDISLEPLELAINFRSTGAIVGWNNRAFATLFPAEADMAAGAVPYAAAIADDENEGEGGVEIVTRFDERPDEAARIVELVQARRRSAPGETIGILVRNKKHAALAMAALREAGFKAQAVDLEPLGDRQVVRDLTALTRALAHLGDRVAWLAILRAPWCGLNLADLAALAEGADGSIWTLLNDAQRLQALSPDGRERAARVIPVLAAALEKRRRQPLRRLIEGTWLALGGPACITEPVDLDNADAFFALLDEVEQAGDLSDAGVLEERLGDLCARPAPDADPGLQVMTIHKAKGLEFDTVIVPALERLPKSDERQLLLWLERPRAGGVPDFLLAPIASAEDRQDALYDSLKIMRQRQDELEQMRLLYVAATRARRRLYLLGSVKHKEGKDGVELKQPNARSLLAKLWPHIAPAFDEAFAAAPSAEPGEAASPEPAPLRRLVSGWQTPQPAKIDWHGGAEPDVAATAAVEYSWAGETARRVGSLVHALLDRIARDGVERWSPEQVEALAPMLEARLRWDGVPAAELETARNRVVTAVTATLADDRGRWLLADHEQAHSEYALSGLVDQRHVSGVIDRTFIEDDVRWIVDYKTGSHQGGGLDTFLASERERYASQMTTYARLFAAMEDRPVRTALYFPLMNGWIEWQALER
ncbi:MAG TPA: UvrD-helicase domain-containing protein [Gammaproteobacteria bacterium]|nr:UvrD-helicase domain-containing protein [Gammaproteobacteria bacterium]